MLCDLGRRVRAGIILPPRYQGSFSFSEITFCTTPCLEEPGKYVRLVATLLDEMGLVSSFLSLDSNPGWKGIDLFLLLEGDLNFRILDWAPEDDDPLKEKWGAESDNMFGVQADDPKVAAEWIAEFFRKNGVETSVEFIEYDKTYDVLPVCLAGCKFNVIGGNIAA